MARSYSGVTGCGCVIEVFSNKGYVKFSSILCESFFQSGSIACVHELQQPKGECRYRMNDKDNEGGAYG